jgi:hypothetical protein
VARSGPCGKRRFRRVPCRGRGAERANGRAAGGPGRPDSARGAVPGDYQRYFRATLEQRIEHFGGLTARATTGTLALTTKSGHFIQASEPDLAVWAIRRVLSSATPHAELERFVGQYQLAPTVTITITRDAARLSLQLTGQPALAMVAESTTRFAIRSASAAIEFEIDSAGNVNGLALIQNGMRHRAPRVK